MADGGDTVGATAGDVADLTPATPAVTANGVEEEEGVVITRVSRLCSEHCIVVVVLRV